MGYWKSKVLPKIKKVFDTNGPKKAAAAEAIKSFDDSKEEINKEFEEKKADLQPKVIEIYEASSTEIKTLVKDPKEAGLKKNSVAVHKFFEELVKIEFPGSKPVSEACSKFGASLVPSPVFFIFEKVSTFIVADEAPKEEEKKGSEEEPEVKPKEEVKDEPAETSKDKDVAVDEEKKEDAAATSAAPAAAEEEKKEAAAETKPAEEVAEPPKKAEEAATTEPPKP